MRSTSPFSALPAVALRGALALLVTLLATLPAHADTNTWDGGFGSSDQWSRKQNWNNNDLNPGDDIVFAGTTRLTNTNDTTAATSYASITFNNTAGAFTLSGDSITLGGSVTNNDADVQTINLGLILSGTRTFNAASGNLAIGGAISGTGFGITKTGSNSLTLTGTNTYTGATTISAGTLQIGDGGTTGSISNTSGVTNNAALVYNRSSGSFTAGYAISGTGTVSKVGASTLILTGTNTYTGATTISAGTLQIGNGTSAGSIASTSGVTNNAALVFNRTGSFTANYAIGGSGTVTKIGSSTLTFTGNNTYAGATTISGGTLELGNGGATGSLSASSAVTNNGWFSFLRSGTVTQGTNFGSVISGTGTLRQRGVGSTVILNGANTYSGPTRVRNGSLVAGANAPSGSAGAFGNATTAIVVGTGSTEVGGNPSLLINGAFTVGRAIAVGSEGNSNSFGATLGGLNTTGTSTFSGNITLGTAATNYTMTLRAATGGTVDFTTGTWTTNNKAIAVGSSGNTGTVRLSNDLATTGAISLNFGTLQIGNGGTTGSISNTSGITNNATLIYNRSDARTVAYGISGNGTVTKQGAGTTTFTANNTYTGATTISAGTLQIGSGGTSGSLAGTSGVTNNAALIYNRSDALSVAYGISGNGTVTKQGTGTTTFTAANTYSGGTTVSAGTLLANNSSGSAAGTGAIAVNNGGTFGGTGSVTGALTINNLGTLSPGVAIETLASGAVTFNTGSTFKYDVNSSVLPGVGADLQIVNGNLSLAGLVDLDLGDIATVPAAFGLGTTFTLVNYSGSWNSGLFTVDGDAIGNGTTFMAGMNTWRLDYDATAGGSNFSGQYVHANYVNIVAVPEPGTIVMLVSAAALGFCLIRRKRA